MPTSASASTSRVASGHDEAVSEILGSVLGIAIVALAVASGLYGLTRIQDSLESRTAVSGADRVAATVAGAATHAASIAAEAAADGVPEPTYRIAIDLPSQLQDRSYGVHLDAATRTIVIALGGVEVSRYPILGAGPIMVCDSGGPGGRLMLAFEDVPSALEAACGVGPTDHAILLRSTP